MIALVGDRREYERFVARTASQAYARCFVLTGDFVAARALLEQAYIAHYPSWNSNEDLEAMFAKVVGSPVSPGEGASSFSRARKIQEGQEATALLASFEPADRVALFLHYVEEIPGESLGGDLALRLDREIAKWRPDDPEALDLFSRILRQHRLPSNFASRVMSRTLSGVLKDGFVMGVVLDVLRVALCVVCVLTTLAWLDWRKGSTEHSLILTRALEQAWPVWFDFFLLVGSFVLTTNLGARDIQRARYRGLRLLQIVGILNLTTILYAIGCRFSFLHSDPTAITLILWTRLGWVVPTFVMGANFMICSRLPRREPA